MVIQFKEKLNYPIILHQSNTSGILNYEEANFNMVRTGIGLNGFGYSEEENKNLKPIATLKSVISQLHTIQPNETVGYNRAYTSKGVEKRVTPNLDAYLNKTSCQSYGVSAHL